ncbi:MAG: hypothetical protein K0Q74_259 [Gammaproteobacteria bacterium]|nr:hypothetical protein [Gammaproteobacteria bacterium]
MRKTRGSIKNVLSTGEALPIELKDKFYAETKANLYNLYGPTESTIFTSYEYCKPSATSITIGRPIDDKQVFILNERKQLQPVGIPGELCVAGRVGRGYYQMPELSQKRFFMQSFNGQLYKLYNTGDIARYLHDGRIEYLGRSDFQIKFKGHRVELSEIETCINKYQGIEKCVVDLKKYKGDSLLVAYYTTQDSAEKFDAQRLRDNLVEHLPNYMIPSFFIGLNSIPLTPSGKIDKKALPDLTEKYILHASAYVAPRNNIEFQLVKMLEQLLQVNKISINDDFFQLGGNSLMAVRFILSIKKNFGKTIPFALLFKKGTISEISKYMDIQPRDLISQTLLPIHQANNSKRTLFFAHPVEGLSYLYTPLASHLRKHSLYGLNNPYFYDRNKVFDSIEEMAEHYVKAIKTVQPNGPYYFCGWSSGGQVVYEMALQLKKQGFEVAAVILIDTYHSSIKIEHEDLDIRIPRVLISEGIDPNSEEGKYFKLEYKQNVALLQKYSEKIYDGRVVLIKAQQIASNIEDDLYNGWRSSLSKQIELYSIPGEHGRLLDLEHIENLSIILNGVLEGNPNTNILSDICLSEIDRQLHFAVLNKDPYLIKRCLSLGGNIEIVEHNHNKALL